MAKKSWTHILWKTIKHDTMKKMVFAKDVKPYRRKEGSGKTMRPYSALLIAKHIISYEAEHNRPVSNLRLQKLLYFVQALFFLSIGEPCFADRIEAWDFGPVVPRIYHTYKRYGSMIIQDMGDCPADEISADDCEKIDEMLDACADKSTRTLVEITHRQKPWQDARGNPFSNEITQAAFRKAFPRVEQAR